MIAPEERAEWRLDAEWGARAFGKGSRSHRILALLDALDAAEADREKWRDAWLQADADRQEPEMFVRVVGAVTPCACSAQRTRAEAAESRARDLEAENARLRALLAEDVALLEELDAAWGGAGGAGL